MKESVVLLFLINYKSHFFCILLVCKKKSVHLMKGEFHFVFLAKHSDTYIKGFRTSCILTLFNPFELSSKLNKILMIFVTNFTLLKGHRLYAAEYTKKMCFMKLRKNKSIFFYIYYTLKIKYWKLLNLRRCALYSEFPLVFSKIRVNMGQDPLKRHTRRTLPHTPRTLV